MRTLALLLVCACGASSMPSDTPTADAPTLTWRTWESQAFAEARSSNRMILVDVGIEGCTACRWMYEDTYTHPDVRERLHEHFVTITVDANARPDLGERYARWGWPALIVLAPDGTQVHAIRGNKRPRNFIPILDALIERHQSGQLLAEASQPIETQPLPDDGWEALGCRTTLEALDSRRNNPSGWNARMTFVESAPVRHGFFRAHAREESARRDHAIRTAEAYASLMDPVWGGVFVAGTETRRIVEKRTKHNASALTAFAHAYHLTGDRLWLQHAENVHRYFSTWMMAGDGMFYATQEDDAPNLPSSMSAQEYYQLGDEERRAHGIPPIDRSVYTDLNGRTISAYATLYAATQDRQWRDVAVRAATSLLETRMQPAGWIRQSAPSVADGDDRMRAPEHLERAYLVTQAAMGTALLDLYQVTGDSRFSDAARQITDATLEALAADGGGFHASTTSETDSLIPRTVPVTENATMARLLLQLGSLTQEESYRDAGLRTLRAITPREGIEQRGIEVLGELALSYEWATLGPVEISIVAEPDDPAATPFLDAAIALWEPRKIVHFEPNGRYPRQEGPIVHVCTTSACSSPLTDPAEIAATAEDLRDASGAPCE
ncbi:MAG: DUF255 domain-containing protein [Myxococcota bacterium]